MMGGLALKFDWLFTIVDFFLFYISLVILIYIIDINQFRGLRGVYVIMGCETWAGKLAKHARSMGVTSASAS